jgi:hypothetical protein
MTSWITPIASPNDSRLTANGRHVSPSTTSAGSRPSDVRTASSGPSGSGSSRASRSRVFATARTTVPSFATSEPAGNPSTTSSRASASNVPVSTSSPNDRRPACSSRSRSVVGAGRAANSARATSNAPMLISTSTRAVPTVGLGGLASSQKRHSA